MRERRARRAVTVLATVVLLLLGAGGLVAVDRLERPYGGGGPASVLAIDPPFTMAYEPLPPVDLPFDPVV